MQRKLLIALAFLVSSTFLIALAIYRGTSLVELSSTIGAQAMGMAAFMYGYSSEYKSKAGLPAGKPGE